MKGAPTGDRARPPPLWMAGGPPLVLSSPNIFYIFQTILREVSGLLELCRIGLSDLLLFQSRIPAAGILPLHVNLVK